MTVLADAEPRVTTQTVRPEPVEELPASWARVPIQDIAAINPRVPKPESDADSLVHFVPMSAVVEEFGGINVSTLRPLREVQKGYTSFVGNDVLFAKITPCMENGKAALVPHLSNTIGFGSTEFHVLRGERGIDPRWLAQFVSQAEFRRLARQNMAGSAGQMRVPTNWLSVTGIPLAPAAEQTRIVEKLEELLSDLDAGVAELKAAQKKLTQYRQSLLKAAVEGALTTNGLFATSQLGTLVTSIGQGWSPKCEGTSSDDDNIWAVMKTTAIQPLAFDGSHNKVLPSDLAPRRHLELVEGDLLITRAGPRNRVGITCLVKKVKERLILCDKAYRLRVDESRILPAFLELVLNAPHMTAAIDVIKTGINDSGLNLTQDRFFSLAIPLPSISDQRKLIEILELAKADIDRKESAIALALKQSTAQRKNILKAAFSGKLVPQDPNDEPASVLLTRIRAERSATGVSQTGGKRRKIVA